MRFSIICSATTLLTCGALACGSSRPTASDPAQNQARADYPPTRGGGAAESERETTVEVSDEIRAECRFPETSADSPRFELDESTLRGPEKNLLDDVASCLKGGPLQNRTVTIVGRTDPRGSTEHNQNLGANRAQATRSYLIARGVPEERLLVKSRGEAGAHGNDEQTWKLDRRVDLVLHDRSDGTLSRERPPLPPANPPQTNINAASGATPPETTPLPPANPPLKNVQKTPSGK